VEIGCRGFPAQSLWRMLGKLGIKAGDKKRAVGRLGQAAEKASNWLWMKREELVANHWHVVSDQHYGSAALRLKDRNT